MRKRPDTSVDEPLDIFSDERLANALAGATRPTTADSAEPQPPLPARPIPAVPPETRASEPEPDAAAHQSPPTTTDRNFRKRRARKPAPPEKPTPPEPNVPLRFRVPQTLRSEFQKFKAELAAVLGGVALDDSNLARPLVEHFLVEHRERILEEAAAFRGQLKTPPERRCRRDGGVRSPDRRYLQPGPPAPLPRRHVGERGFVSLGHTAPHVRVFRYTPRRRSGFWVHRSGF